MKYVDLIKNITSLSVIENLAKIILGKICMKIEFEAATLWQGFLNLSGKQEIK